MNVWATVFLGVIALATLVTAVMQIGLIIAAGKAARRMERLADRIERELTPIFAHLNTIGENASRAAALATAQMERVDRVFADVAKRLDDTVRTVHSIVTGPVGRGAAMATAFRSVLSIVRDIRARRRRRSDEEDALFI